MLKVCSNDHEEIRHRALHCPVCLIKLEVESLEEKIEELEEDIEALEEENDNLKRNL